MDNHQFVHLLLKQPVLRYTWVSQYTKRSPKAALCCYYRPEALVLPSTTVKILKTN